MKLPLVQSSLHSSKRVENLERIAGNAAHHITRSLVQRTPSDSSSGSSSSSTCKPGDDSAKCQTPASVQSSQNLAIILGVVIPLSCAIIVLIFLHRRHLKKQRLEDINDPHKSLDFGMDGIEPAISKTSKASKISRKPVPEMRVTELGGASARPSRRGNQMSLDMGMHMDSPYLLPAGLQGSHESLHSLSRKHDEHDPYRPVTMMRPSTDNDSEFRFGRLNDDKGSLYSMSTGHHSNLQGHDRAGLVSNARPMSQSYQPHGKPESPDSASPHDSAVSTEFPPRQLHSSITRANNPAPLRKSSLDKALPEINEKEMLTSPITPPEPVAQRMPPSKSSSKVSSARSSTSFSVPRPPRKDSMSTVRTGFRPESSNYGDEEPLPAHNIVINEPEPYDVDPAMIYSHYSGDGLAQPTPQPAMHAPEPGAGQNRLSAFGPAGNRLSVMGMRPLPPDLPEDNPEVRANRIRSFYKEYFDDSKPHGGNMAYTDDDYYDGFDGVIYDPDTGGFYAQAAKPWAQGPARRAMTPPPRARPRVSGNSTLGPHQRRLSTMSGGRPRGRSLPKKKLPPPKDLMNLPTPHLMRDDSAIFNAADFAPPTTFRNYQNGSRPSSPMGGPRPYSPSVRAFTPLASSFENLAALPSPHDLRKSGTFTALDFAPPSKIRDPAGSGSDAGSIRSNRSGMSAMQANAVREGAYRVSRIPKNIVTTQADLANQLRPKMDMSTPA